VDLRLLLAGARPAAKLEVLTPARARAYARLAAGHGLAAVSVDAQGEPSPESRGFSAEEGAGSQALFLARDERVLEELVGAERRERRGGPGRADAIRLSGRLLGYPHCCVDHFASLERQDDPRVLAAYAAGSGPGDPLSWMRAAGPLLNFFPPMVSPVTWYPCSLECAHSKTLAHHWANQLTRGHEDEPMPAWDETLAGAVVAFERLAFVQLHGARRVGDRLQYEGVSDALSFSGEPALTRSSRLARFREQVTLRFAAAGRLQTTRSLLVLEDSYGRRVRGNPKTRPLLILFPESGAPLVST